MAINRFALNLLDDGGAGDGDRLTFDAVTGMWVPKPSTALVDPTTTKGDLIVRGSSVLDRLGVGADGQVLTADAAAALGVKWAAAGGGGGSSRSYLGTNSVGGSIENMTLGRMYAKKVTAPPSGAALQSVQAYFSQAATASFTMKSLVWADNAGTPGVLLGAAYATDVVLGSAGWRGFPLGIELAASTAYWIGVCVSNMPIGSGSMGIAYASSGTDRYQQSGTVTQVGDWLSAFSPVTTTKNYSIRGLIIT